MNALQDENTGMEITATEINYLHICPRKLWLFRHGIRPESENVNVQLGRLLDEEAFQRKDKNIAFGESCVIDWASFKDGIIHETKKSRNPEKADIAQVKFYMYHMKMRGLRVESAVIHYPLSKRTVTIPWSDDIIELIRAEYEECMRIITSDKIPQLESRPYCKSCAYMEICFI